MAAAARSIFPFIIASTSFESAYAHQLAGRQYSNSKAEHLRLLEDLAGWFNGNLQAEGSVMTVHGFR